MYVCMYVCMYVIVARTCGISKLNPLAEFTEPCLVVFKAGMYLGSAAEKSLCIQIHLDKLGNTTHTLHTYIHTDKLGNIYIYITYIHTD